MKLTGRNFLGSSRSSEGSELLVAVDPSNGLPLEDGFYVATDEEVDRAVTLAAQACRTPVDFERRARFLNTVAGNLESLGNSWLDMAHRETALPYERLWSERLRTVNQLRLFANLVTEGSWVDARIDLALPDRKPLPKPDFRRMLVEIGPVAVFGASNFPFAYSVAGGDTASAFAAGCPVIVKAHPAHPGTSEMAASAVLAAAIDTGMPEGTFSMVHGGSHVGVSLVRHPLLAAVGFTGSLAGGRALLLAASSRANPIPVHAEMGSVNPVFLLPGALTNRVEEIARGLSQSVILGVGQYCTNPGLIVAVEGQSLQQLKELLVKHMSEAAPSPMLTSGIRDSYLSGTVKWEDLGSTPLLNSSKSHAAGTQVCPAVFEVNARDFLANHHLADEVFGPATLIVCCRNDADMISIAESLPGQLTASIHGEAGDFDDFADLIGVLTSRVGRLIYNAYPTSVEVTPAMNHSGPYPACSDVRFTSVGTASIYRFSRPICFQNAPQELLPAELQNSNPRKIRRLIDGESTERAI